MAANLRAYKARRRFTTAQVVSLVGMSKTAVSMRLSGATPCSLDDLERFASAFGVEVGELINTG